ncbi:MAG: FGGY-family carbohydrate kinase [Chloroflexi bacterium]|nr:FGGY-family carbohydrate kinase [Chloroflexota bacterium]
MTLVLGIDIGTHESKGVLVTTSGRIVASAAVPHATETPRPGWAEHDADGVWWHDLVTLSQTLLAQAGVGGEAIGAVGCSAIGPCVLPVDAAGRPLRPAILYGIDTRAAEEITELTDRLGPDWILRQTGSALSAQAAGPKILWLRRHEPDVWARTHRVMTSTSYLVYRLTSRVVIDHYTAAAYGPLYDLHTRDWAPAALDLVCDRALLPEIDWTAAVAGHIHADAARATGLREGTPVIVGTADAASEATAAGVRDPGDTMIMYGSSGFLIAVSDRLLVSTAQWPTVYLHPGTYALAAGMSTTGALLTWFRDTLGPSLTDGTGPTAELEGLDAAFTLLAQEAARVPPGADGLLALPYWSGERTPINDPLARGVILGLTLSHTRGHVYRALIEGIAYGLRDNLDAMEAAGVSLDRLVAIGGGTGNELWVRTVSDVTGRPQQVQRTPGAALGDAMLAAAGTGLVPDLEATRTWVEPGPVIAPDPATQALHDDRYALYRALYRDTSSIAHALATDTRRGPATHDPPTHDPPSH